MHGSNVQLLEDNIGIQALSPSGLLRATSMDRRGRQWQIETMALLPRCPEISETERIRETWMRDPSGRQGRPSQTTTAAAHERQPGMQPAISTNRSKFRSRMSRRSTSIISSSWKRLNTRLTVSGVSRR